ncbi:MAG: alpha/beta hydrolase [Actinomycetota bacterium]|nr:alpha/beta hydrolase [Actinomycetota bacterium]
MTPKATTWNHGHAETNGIRVHYVREGSGRPLVLLHGWPEFWFTWRKNIPALAERFDVVAPDLRGFGGSEKPGLPEPPGRLLDELVEDLRGLADALGIARFGLVSHDVGSFVAQRFAARYPDRVLGLFFFNCVYPGIGRRWLEPESVGEIWYQSFHRQPWAADLVGSSREACAIYLKHFLDHWAAEPGVFDEDFEAWVDNFMQPGNLQGGFDWYEGIGEARMKMMREGAPVLPKLEPPAYFLWGESDPILKVRWADRLGDYFANFEFERASGAGHFVHYEKPELANGRITRFFSGL